MIDILRTHQFDKGEYQNELTLKPLLKFLWHICVYMYCQRLNYIVTNCEFEKLVIHLKVFIIVQN